MVVNSFWFFSSSKYQIVDQSLMITLMIRTICLKQSIQKKFMSTASVGDLEGKRDLMTNKLTEFD